MGANLVGANLPRGEAGLNQSDTLTFCYSFFRAKPHDSRKKNPVLVDMESGEHLLFQVKM